MHPQTKSNIEEIKKQLSANSINADFVGFSETNGCSIYFRVGEQKLRFSDHSTTNIDRVLGECHFRLPIMKLMGMGGIMKDIYNDNTTKFKLYGFTK